jgi:aminoglycoside phosphotransferase (APT) family kinase protein
VSEVGSGVFDPLPTDRSTILDPDWLAASLDIVGDGDRVVGVELVGSSRTIAEKVRFTVAVERADGTLETYPLCAKGHFDGGMNSLHTEAAFYRWLRPTLDVRSPRAYHSGVDLEARRGLVVMDDILALGGTVGSAHEPYTLDTCRDSLGQLARLHASTWQDLDLDVDWLAPRISPMAELFPTDRLQELLDDGRGPDLPAELRDAELLKEAMHRTAEQPLTCVIHGDTHSGNSYRDAQGRSCWFDWQVTQRGHWSIDVAYHLGTVLTVDDRRRHEADLLLHYLDELARFGIDAPEFDAAWDAYARGFPWGFFLWAITQVSSREVVLVHVPRLGAALVDHDTYGRLGVV